MSRGPRGATSVSGHGHCPTAPGRGIASRGGCPVLPLSLCNGNS